MIQRQRLPNSEFKIEMRKHANRPIETLRAELKDGSPLHSLHRRGFDGLWRPRYGGKRCLAIQLDRAMVVSDEPLLRIRGQQALRALRAWLCEGHSGVSDLTLRGAEVVLKSAVRRGEVSLRGPPVCADRPAGR